MTVGQGAIALQVGATASTCQADSGEPGHRIGLPVRQGLGVALFCIVAVGRSAATPRLLTAAAAPLPLPAGNDQYLHCLRKQCTETQTLCTATCDAAFPVLNPFVPNGAKVQCKGDCE